MRCWNLILTLLATSIASSAFAGTIPGRIVMGTSDTAVDGFPRFFDSSSDFTQGDTSHTHTVAFDDGVGQVVYNITIEAFNSAGPAGLNVGTGATGIELGVDNSRIDPGESIVVTYNSITHSQIAPGPGPINPLTYDTKLNALHFNSFGAGDTYTYSGVGAGGATGDDTNEILLGASIATGDSFTIMADTGAFRLQWISQVTQYELIPEPTTLALCTLVFAPMLVRRRND